MTDHPITPPPELIQKWWDGTHGAFYEFETVTTQAAQWGANQELEACCEWVSQWCCMVGDSRPEVGLRAARRPKSKSLAEQKQTILAEIDELLAQMNNAGALAVAEPIRRALERLQELEGQDQLTKGSD